MTRNVPRSDEIVSAGEVQAADFTGFRVPDRFVFGFEMDVGGSWRNLPSIRARAETSG